MGWHTKTHTHLRNVTKNPICAKECMIHSLSKWLLGRLKLSSSVHWHRICPHRCRFEPHPKDPLAIIVDTALNARPLVVYIIPTRSGASESWSLANASMSTICGVLPKGHCPKFRSLLLHKKVPERAEVKLSHKGARGGFQCRWVVGVAWATSKGFKPFSILFKSQFLLLLSWMGSLCCDPCYLASFW